MSAYHPNILYIGNTTRRSELAAFVEAYDWYVLQPTLVEQALAHYVFFMPDIVVIDGVADRNFTLADLQETYFHLHSICADPVLILSENWDLWDIHDLAYSTLLPDDVVLTDIVNGIQDLIQHKTGQMPALTLQPNC